MSFKTILVHLANDPEHRNRLILAQHLAEQYQAHVVALFITNSGTSISGRAASAAYLAEIKHANEKKAQALRQEFDSYFSQAKINHSWIIEEGDHLELTREQAHIADLVIVGQAHPEHLEDYISLQLPERLIVSAGCPVIVVPDGGVSGAIGRNILIAFTMSREAGRAVRCALPFLKSAQTVTLFTKDQSEKKIKSSEIADYLARHGIKTEIAPEALSGRDIGEEILHQAEQGGHDLVVMGAYGYSKLHEFLWGGASRTIFSKAKIPLFVSH